MEVVVAENALVLVLRVLKPLTSNDTQKSKNLFKRAAAAVQLWLKKKRAKVQNYYGCR